MAYVFDPINNTLIDDEDKSLGNKLQLMDGGRVNFDIGTNLTSAQKKQTLYTKLLKELPEGYLEDYKKVFLIENKDGTFSRKSGDAGGIQFMKEKYGNVIKDIKTRQGNVKNIDRKIGEFNSAILQDLQKNNKIVSALDDSDLKRGSRIKTTAPFDAKGSKNFNFHHIMNIGGEIPLDTNDIAVISKTMNAKLSPYNKNLNNISDAISTLINEQPKNYLKRIDKLNDQAEGIVKKAVKELPKEYKNLIGFNRVVPVLDEYGTPINFVGKKVGGSNQNKPGIKLEDLTKKQATALRKQIKTDALSFEKAGLKDKILSSTGKVLKGVGKVIKPVGYAVGTKALFDAQALAKEQGIELSNFDKFLAVDSGDPLVAINNYQRRNDPEFAAAERAKDLAKMSDDFEEVGLDEVKPDETLQDFMANGGRAGFNNGGAAGADVNFATQLEYFLTNEDAELPQLSTYKETKNPIEVFNDIIDPRNYPYYADVLARSGVRIAEFGARVLPATGKLISDTIQKGAFKVKKNTDSRYIQDYTDVMPSNIKGTGIFSEFLENITPTSLEKKIGLASLIEKEEQKQIDRGSTVGPKVFADTIGLGAEVTAPIFPGLKLLRAYAKSRNLPADNVTKEILVKEIDEVLETQGMNRREFLQTTGAGATLILAKMLGFGDEVAQTAKVVEKAAAAPAGVPPYFFQLVDKIKTLGDDVTAKNAISERQVVTRYKDFELTEDVGTGEITIQRIKTDSDFDYYDETLAEETYMNYKPGQGDETTKGTPAAEYIEDTGYLRTSGPDKGELYDTKEGLTDDTLKDIEEILKDSK